MPSADGKAAVSTNAGHTTAKVRDAQRPWAPNSSCTRAAKAPTAIACVATATAAIPKAAASG